MNRRPSHQLGYIPHSQYGDLGFSFKKTLKRIKKKSKVASKSIRKSSTYKKAVSQVKASPKTRSLLTRAKSSAMTKQSPKQIKLLRKMGFKVPTTKRRTIKARPKPVTSRKRRASSVESAVSATPTRKPVTGPRGKQGRAGTRGYPGSRGRTGARGPPGQSIASTERWKHKLEKDRMMRAYQNQQRVGRERSNLHEAHIQEMQKRNTILSRRISEQEALAAKVNDKAGVYNQWRSLKEATQETIFPTLGGIDIEDEYVASSVSALPWLILGIALITREG